jgi:hypothetical protein
MQTKIGKNLTDSVRTLRVVDACKDIFLGNLTDSEADCSSSRARM